MIEAALEQAAHARLAARAFEAAQDARHSIGVSVSETNVEATIAIVTTTANSLKMRPMTPPISSTGMNTATSEIVIEMMVKPISRAALQRRLEGREAVLLDVADDVLEHDDGVVDDEADRQRQPQQRDVVDARSRTDTSPPSVAISEIGTASAGMIVAETRRRNRKITRITSAMVSTSVNWTSLDRGADRGRAVVEQLQARRAAGSCVLERRQHRLDAVDDVDRVGVGLALHGQDDRARAVVPARRLSLSRPNR